MPCLLTHGNLVEHTSARALTDSELYNVHGWGTLGTLRNDGYSSDIMQVIASLSSSSQSVSRNAKTFVGNSMHVPSALAVLLYGFTHMLRLSDMNSKAWLITRRSASWSNEMAASPGRRPAVHDAGSSAKSKGKGKSKGRGQKRQLEEAAAEDVSFRRASSTIFD